ncbi:hypothetical protein KY290_017856 [Solanum tuberosum]|uniref:CCHC-type domain-containing protein n=1 Tax=Solanum tuberosum TaxID=4113 RepID=A0ABQ7VEJ7_SOLTU|nr:hypothetical protein KY290_017856 [Solanum tuberosum]
MLGPYKTAKAMWDYLQKVYNQDNSANCFQLKYEIANYSQGGLSAVHEQSKRDHFLMKLRSDFESVLSNLMNRDPSPSLDVCFRELLREEQYPVTQNAFKKENGVIVAFATQGKGKGMDMTRTQCYSCGHIIRECPTHPQNRRVNAFQARINGSTIDNSSSGQVLTPEMVQQMIVSAFSALGLQGSGVGDDNSEGA